jgi:ABC-type branched-subunit amino acid transport system substrate-binding protein
VNTTPCTGWAAKTRRVSVLAALLGATVILLAACGGSSGGQAAGASSGAGSGSSLSGSPIKVMTITTLNSQGPVYPMIKETADIYGEWINAHGGIKGHPLQVTVCDDQGEPTEASACARQAVADHDVAVVGSYSFFGDSIVPILKAANIAWFGVCCAGTPDELTYGNSFPLGSSLMYAVGLVQRAVQDGCKRISSVVIDGAQPYIEPMDNALKALGTSFVRPPIILPQTSTDDSSYVTRATSGSDCLIMIVSETLWKPWFAAYQAVGATQRLYGPQGNLDSVSIQGFQSIANGDVIAGSFPDISTAPWKDYREALATYHAPSTMDYNSLGGLGTWAGYTAFTKIASGISGTLTATSFLNAASHTTDLNLDGMVPAVNFTKPWTDGLKGYTRLFNRSVYFSEVKNGKIVPLTSKPENVSNLALGK